MFRRALLLIIISSVSITGCNNKEQPPSKTVSVFNNVPSIKPDPTEPNNCIWKTAKLSVFNQTAQTISFDYSHCPNDGEPNFIVKNGNNIIVKASIIHMGTIVSNEEYIVLTIFKTTSLTDGDFMRSLIPKTKQSAVICDVFKNTSGDWKIGLSKPTMEKSNGWVMYPSLSTDAPKYADANNICGAYSYTPDNDFSFRISQGIAIGYNTMYFDLLNFIDLNSVTYENKG